MAVTVANWVTQPPRSQPDAGPKARVVHTKVVPQSGISLLSSRKAKAVSRIGTNPRSSAAGARCPTATVTKPSVTAML